jgi:hypothetical protein
VAPLGEYLRINSKGYTSELLSTDGRSYAATWKRMVDYEKNRHAKITDSRNAILKICKEMYETG